jgi:dTMP kinase
MLQRPFQHGLLVAIEGIDGAGKTTAATLLAQYCGEKGVACLLSKEPTGNQWGRELRETAKAGRLTLEKEMELFVADRREHVARAIQPALNEGSVVILDRYFYSTAAYQGARGADVAGILATNRSFAPEPHLTLLLDLDVAEGLQRIRKRGDKPNHFENVEGLTAAREIFLQTCAHAKIDANEAPSDVWKQILAAFRVAVQANLKPELTAAEAAAVADLVR